MGREIDFFSEVHFDLFKLRTCVWDTHFTKGYTGKIGYRARLILFVDFGSQGGPLSRHELVLLAKKVHRAEVGSIHNIKYRKGKSIVTSEF